jgi:hypothetical protein
MRHTHLHIPPSKQSSSWLRPQVANLDLPGAEVFRKLQLLKSEKGGLSASDERQFVQLRR